MKENQDHFILKLPKIKDSGYRFFIYVAVDNQKEYSLIQKELREQKTNGIHYHKMMLTLYESLKRFLGV